VLLSRRVVVTLILMVLALSIGAPALLAQQPVVVRLGLLTAADSPAGRGAQLAIAEINGSGGIVGPDGMIYAFELLSVPVETTEEVRAGLAALSERDVLAILGPDDSAVVLATFNDLRALDLPIMTAATGDTITVADTSDLIFRTRAPEQVYVQAAAEYLVSTLTQPVVAIVQEKSGGVTAESVVDFTAALGNLGVFPLSTLEVDDPEDLDGVLATLVNLRPDVVAVWGQPEVAADLFLSLRERGWDGTYLYRDAVLEAFRMRIAGTGGPLFTGNVLGVTNWVPGVRSTISDNFLRNYVVTFGTVPDALSAAYYDAVYLLSAALRESGADPAALRQALQNLPGQAGVQGTLSPAQFFIGETTNAAVVVELNPYTVPQVRSLFVGGQLVPNEGDAVFSVTRTPQPVLPSVTPTPAATATPEGVYGTVTSFRLNVRTGPGTNYDVLGQLSQGDTVFPVGANLDFTWMVIPFRGTTGWVAAYLLDLNGNLSDLPIIVPPPSPTPAATSTPSPAPFADLVVTAAAIDPLVPLTGQPFNVRATVFNLGNVASVETALAATFIPGDVYVSSVIPPLAPGQSTEVVLSPTVDATGTYTVQLVIDLNNLVNEGPAGEANNLYPVTYSLDHAVLATGMQALVPVQEHDLIGSGTSDLRWDGAALEALNGAGLGVMAGLNWETVHYGQLVGLGGASILTSIPRGSLPAGTVLVVITAPESYLGVLRIDGYDGDTLRYTYRIYAP